MSSFNVKSVLLGIGIGIIITATASIIYVAGRDPMKDLTEQQIISQAEKYGMVKASLLQNNTDMSNKKEDNLNKKAGGTQ